MASRYSFLAPDTRTGLATSKPSHLNRPVDLMLSSSCLALSLSACFSSAALELNMLIMSFFLPGQHKAHHCVECNTGSHL